MPALIPFVRTATLAAPAPTLSSPSLPATAQHLMFLVRARSHNQTAVNLVLGLRLNAEAGPNTYDGNTLRFTSATAGGQADDGIDLEQISLGDLTPSDVESGVWNVHWGLIPRYAQSEPHMVVQLGFGRPDDLNTSDANFATYLGGSQHRPGVNAAVSTLQLFAEVGDLAVGTEITCWGLLGSGDAAVMARTAGAVGAIDFNGDEFKDVTLAPGANVFTSTNPRLGRTISLRLSGGDGTTTVTLPAGTVKLRDTYVAGQAAWLVIRCVDEVGPGFIATLSDEL